MPLQFSALVPSASSMATFLANQLKAPVAKGLGLDTLSKAFRNAIERFLTAMQAEFERSETLHTVLQPAIERSVSSFIKSESVQQVLAIPFRDPGSFDVSALSSIWHEIPLESAEGKLIDLPPGFDWDAVGASYLASVRSIVVETPELREIWLSNNVDEIRRSVEAIQGVPAKFDLEKYRRSLIEDFGTLKLSAIRVDCDPNHWDERVFLQSVYVPQKVKEAFPPRDASRDYRRRSLRETPPSDPSDSTPDSLVDLYRLAPVRPIQEVLQDPSYNRMVILGDPGLGKSTLLEHIALNWAQGVSAIIPFLVELRKYTHDHARPKSFLEYLEIGTWSSCRLPQAEVDRVLRRGSTVMLFDGLDEIFAEDLRANVVAEIIRFCREYPFAKVLVTTRAIGYVLGSPNPEHFRSAGFRHLTLQDFDDHEIAEFIQKWYLATIPSNLERAAVTDRLISATGQSRSIRELASNPLLLTMMVLLNQRKHLPRERLKLYESCAELLVEGWDAARHLGRSEYLTHEDKIEILRQVAFQMQQEKKSLAGNAISENKLKAVLVVNLQDLAVGNPKVVAEKIVEGLVERDFMLCSIGDEQFAFVHRTFLEYFCAQEYIEHLKNAGDKEELLQLFRARWSDDSWHEVLRLVCAMAGPDFASELIRELLNLRAERSGWRAIFLAAECVAEIRQAGRVEALKAEIKTDLVKLLEFHAPTEHYQVRADADQETVAVRLGALDRIVRLWPDEETRGVLKHAATNQYWKVRYRAAEMLAKYWPTDETRRWLENLTNNESALVVQAAIRGLVAGWPDETTRRLLLGMLDTSRENVPRSNVIRELSETWPAQTTWEWLTSRAANEHEDYAAGEATRELARRWRDERTKQWLLERVVADEKTELREVAASQLVSYWSKEQIEDVMLKLASQNENPRARDAALISLVRSGNPRVREFVVSRLYHIEDAEARRSLLYDLVWRWPDQTTMDVLLDLASRDESSNVRQAAIHQLTRQWRQEVTHRIVVDGSERFNAETRISFIRELIRQWPDPRTQRLLKRVAVEDKHAIVRSEVLIDLERTWPGESTYDFLRNRATEDRDPSVRATVLRLLGPLAPIAGRGEAVSKL